MNASPLAIDQSGERGYWVARAFQLMEAEAQAAEIRETIAKKKEEFNGKA